MKKCQVHNMNQKVNHQKNILVNKIMNNSQHLKTIIKKLLIIKIKHISNNQIPTNVNLIFS